MFYSVAETNSARVWQSFIMASPFFCSEETGQLWLTRKGKRLNKLPVKYGVGNILRAFPPHFATEVMSLRGWTSRMLWRRCSETLLFTMVWLEVCVKQSRLWTSTFRIIWVLLMSHAHILFAGYCHAGLIMHMQAPGSPMSFGKELLRSRLHQADWGTLQWTSDQTSEGTYMHTIMFCIIWFHQVGYVLPVMIHELPLPILPVSWQWGLLFSGITIRWLRWNMFGIFLKAKCNRITEHVLIEVWPPFQCKWEEWVWVAMATNKQSANGQLT